MKQKAQWKHETGSTKPTRIITMIATTTTATTATTATATATTTTATATATATTTPTNRTTLTTFDANYSFLSHGTSTQLTDRCTPALHAMTIVMTL